MNQFVFPIKKFEITRTNNQVDSEINIGKSYGNGSTSDSYLTFEFGDITVKCVRSSQDSQDALSSYTIGMLLLIINKH